MGYKVCSIIGNINYADESMNQIEKEIIYYKMYNLRHELTKALNKGYNTFATSATRFYNPMGLSVLLQVLGEHDKYKIVLANHVTNENENVKNERNIKDILDDEQFYNIAFCHIGREYCEKEIFLRHKWLINNSDYIIAIMDDSILSVLDYAIQTNKSIQYINLLDINATVRR